MTKQEKTTAIEELKLKFNEFNYFYITDTSALSVAQINMFRKFLYEKGIEYKVVKNTLIAQALKSLSTDYTEFNSAVLKGASGIMFTTTGNLPAKALTEFKKATKIDKIVFKGASIDTSFYIGESSLVDLTKLKSKQEMIGEILMLLQSPAKNVLGSLLSGEQKLAGLVKAIADKKAA